MSNSKLFNFSTLLTENTFDLVKKVKEKNCLSEALQIISSLDEQVQSNTNNLYSSLLEAESKKAENACFGRFYAEYKSELLKYKNKMNELAAQFCINLENYVDANKDVLDKCCCCPEGTTFQGAVFTNLLSDDIPNIDPYKAFKKEWAFLGRLFQDLDPTAPDEEKSKIIATVYNSLSKEISEGWLDKCVQKITDCDDCCRDSFARVIYNKFAPSGCTEITLDTPTIEQAKLSLKNYTNYTDCISKSADDFCDGIDKIACEIGSMMFRNADKKFVVNTDEEGVANTTYRMSDYSMNQINLFLTTKLSQIRELVNLYTVALSVKMDCIYKYFNQCVAMINASCDEGETSDESQPEEDGDDVEISGEEIETSEDEPAEDDSEEDNDLGDMELPTDKTQDDSSEESEPEEGEDNSTVDNDVDGMEDNTPVSGEDSSEEPVDDDSMETPEDDEEENVEDQPQEESYISEIEKELYLFEAEIFLDKRYNEYVKLNKSFIQETDQQQSQPTAAPNEASGDGKVSIIQKAKTLIGKVRDSYNKTYATQIKFISDNKNVIMSGNVPDNWTIQKYNTDLLKGLKVVPFNTADAELLKDSNKYLDTKYSRIVGPAKDKASINDRVMAKVYDEREQKYGDLERNAGYQFIVADYKKFCDHYTAELEKLSNFYNKRFEELNDANKQNKEQQKQKATKESTMEMYFKEDSIGEAQGTVTNMSPAEESDILLQYLLISNKILTVAMNIHIKNFKKQYAFLNKLYKINSKNNK